MFLANLKIALNLELMLGLNIISLETDSNKFSTEFFAIPFQSFVSASVQCKYKVMVLQEGIPTASSVISLVCNQFKL